MFQKKLKGSGYFGTTTIIRKDEKPMSIEQQKILFNQYLNDLIKREKCTLSLLEKGQGSLYGHLFILKLDKEYLKSIDENTPVLRNNQGEPVKNIIIKMIIITRKTYEENIGSKKATPVNDFKYEVQTQTDIYDISNKYIQAITPSIFDAFIVPSNDLLIEDLLSISDKNARKKIINIQSYRNYEIGLIFMEIAEGYITLGEYLNKNWYLKYNPNKNTKKNQNNKNKTYKIKNTSLLAKTYGMMADVINRLYKYGYAHSDLHNNNILINPYKYVYYIDNRGRKVKGNVLLIDFGRTEKITPDKKCINEPYCLAQNELYATGDAHFWSYRDFLGDKWWGDKRVKEYFIKLQQYRQNNKTKYPDKKNEIREKYLKIYYNFDGEITERRIDHNNRNHIFFNFF